jgi:predicted SAM-dependent methyltransferase
MNIKIKSILNKIVGDFWWEYCVNMKNSALWEYRVWKESKKSKKYFSKLNFPIKLHLGCGPSFKKGWVNTDISQNSSGSVDGILDLRRPFPFSNESCLEVYSSHVFEHLPYPKVAMHILQESQRVLVAGGVFRVVVPVLDPFLDQTKKMEWDHYTDWVLSLKHPEVVFGTQAEVVNFLFRQGGQHHFIYDFETIQKLLLKAGFQQVVKSEYDSEKDPTENMLSLHVEAYK